MLKPRSARVAVPTDAVKRIPSSVAAPSDLAITEGMATEALITVETDAIRYTVDGTTPTATRGHRVPEDAGANQIVLDTSRDVQAFRCIACDGVAAVIEVTCQ